MTTNGNGKWQLAFWIISGFLGILLIAGAPAIIANDQRIENKVDTIQIATALDISEIKISMARIEEKINQLAK